MISVNENIAKCNTNLIKFEQSKSVKIDDHAVPTLIPFTSNKIVNFDKSPCYNRKNYNKHNKVNLNSLPIHPYLIHLSEKQLNLLSVQFLNKRLLILNELKQNGLFTKCMNKLPNSNKIQVINGKPNLSGYSKCKSKFCPICGYKSIYTNRSVLNDVIGFNKESSNLFITFTVPHDIKMSFKTTFDLLNKTFKEFVGHNEFNYSLTQLTKKNNRKNVTAIKDLIGLEGIYKNYDHTFNFTSNGDHPHFACIFLSNKNLSKREVKLISSLMNDLWSRLLYKNAHDLKTYDDQNVKSLLIEKSKLSEVKKHGVYVIDSNKCNYDKITSYLTNNLPLSNELTNYTGKITKSNSNYNLKDLYNFLLFPEASPISYNRIIAKLHEFTSVLKSKHLNQWLKCSNEINLIVVHLKDEIIEGQKKFSKDLRDQNKRIEAYHNEQIKNAIRHHLEGHSKPLLSLNDETIRQKLKLHYDPIQCIKQVVLKQPEAINHIIYNKIAVKVANTGFKGNLILNSS